MKVEICVGSSCHLKGSNEVVKIFQRLIKENNLENEVELAASFCLGFCSLGVAMRINEKPVVDVNPSNAEKVFYEEVLKVVRG